MPNVTAIIDLKALVHNMELIKSKAPKSKIIAIVKANAYGHGLLQAAGALLELVDGFGVARIGEAKVLHENGFTKPIFLLEGFYNQEDVPVISRFGFVSAIHDEEQIRMIQNSKVEKPLECFLKIDIGMHRLGANPEDVDRLAAMLNDCPQVKKPIGLVSHLSVADTPPEFDYNRQQISYFNETAKRFKGPLCLANSAGIMEWPESHTEYVRPGIIMYGITPFPNESGADRGLIPVMTLKSTIIALRRVKKGAKVGYGAAWVAPNDTVVGIIAMGYGDGYPRNAPNGTPVYVNGRLVPTSGHVCMDMMFVDLGPDSKDRIGDEAVLWGKELPVERIADLCGTIPYELVCKIMPRVRFEYINPYP